MKALFNQYKYKIAYALCLLAAVGATHASIQYLFSNSTSGESPVVILHIAAFLFAIVMVLLALYFRHKDTRSR